MTKEYDFLLTTGATPEALNQWKQTQNIKAVSRYVAGLTECELKQYVKHYLKISPAKISPEDVRQTLTRSFLFSKQYQQELAKNGENVYITGYLMGCISMALIYIIIILLSKIMALF